MYDTKLYFDFNVKKVYKKINMNLLGVFVNPPISIILIIIFVISSSITTFDKRMIQARKAGTILSDEPMLPSWVAGVYWIHYGLMVLILILNWKYAIGLFIIGFIFEVLPVWEIIGNMLMRPFRPKT